jgi:F420-dependent oxidoreductase-like protein
MTDSQLRFGVFIPQGWRMDLGGIGDPVTQYAAMRHVAGLADDEPAIDSIWLYDHLHTLPEPTHESNFECWTTTAALARDTRRVKVGQMATCNAFRPPSLLAKMASTVDVLSNGRLIVGLGAGWDVREANAFGIPFPETRERMARFAEACEVLTRLWTTDEAQFEGRYYRLDGATNRPRREPPPALWIAGGGEQITLRLVARFGDACNVGGSPETIRHKFDVLQRHCEQVGRDFATITRSTSVEELYIVSDESEIPRARARLEQTVPAPLAASLKVGTAESHAQHLSALAQAGATYFIVYLRQLASEPDQLTRFARDVIPRVNAA